jgi:hypothetical protein
MEAPVASTEVAFPSFYHPFLRPRDGLSVIQSENNSVLARCIFGPIFVHFRVKWKIELFKKTIDILNSQDDGVNKIIVLIKINQKNNT